MRILPRAVLAALLLLGPSAGVALAVTTTQLIDLMKAGLSDEVLIALIETDGSTFQLSASDILQLHKAGLSSAVILAMQKTALVRPKPVRPTAPETVAAVGAEPAPIVQEQVVQPVGFTPSAGVINVVQTVAQNVTTSPAIVPVVPYAIPIFVRPRVAERPAPPQYWGWNGQRRPDSWPDAPQPDPPASKTVPLVKKLGGS